MIVNNSKFSVLISNFNNGKYLQNAIDSVLNQTYKNIEIVIVDDGSTDNSISIINQYRYDPRFVICLLNSNNGQGFVKNKLIELSSGHFLGYLDSDDALDTLAVELMVDAHHKNESASLIYSQNYVCNEDLEIKWINDNTKSIKKNYLEEEVYSIFSFSTFKRSFLSKIELWNPLDKRAMDQDLYYKLEEVGSLIFIKKPLYFYRRHENNLTSTDGQLQSLAWHFKYIYEACVRRNRLDLFPIVVSKMLQLRERSVLNSIKKRKKKNLFWKLVQIIKSYILAKEN